MTDKNFIFKKSFSCDNSRIWFVKFAFRYWGFKFKIKKKIIQVQNLVFALRFYDILPKFWQLVKVILEKCGEICPDRTAKSHLINLLSGRLKLYSIFIKWSPIPTSGVAYSKWTDYVFTDCGQLWTRNLKSVKKIWHFSRTFNVCFQKTSTCSLYFYYYILS